LTGAGAVAVTGPAGSGDTGTRTRQPPSVIDGGDAGSASFGFGGFGGGQGGGGGGGGGNLWLPIRYAGGAPDDRYLPKAPSYPALMKGALPKGWTCTITAGTEEYSQQETCHPDWLNAVIAVNKAGDPTAGTLVYDLEDDGSLGRSARLQSLLSVQEIGGATVLGP